MLVFNSLPEALRQGFQVYDPHFTDHSMLLRRDTDHGWELALFDPLMVEASSR